MHDSFARYVIVATPSFNHLDAPASRLRVNPKSQPPPCINKMGMVADTMFAGLPAINAAPDQTAVRASPEWDLRTSFYVS